VTARRSMYQHLSVSGWCSTSAASHGTRCAASSYTKSISTWRNEAGDSVKVFNVKSRGVDGSHHGAGAQGARAPVLHRETLYIGASGTGNILALDLSTPPSGELEARVVIDGKLDAPQASPSAPTAISTWPSGRSSGYGAFSSEGKKKETFIDNLLDMPEFLVYFP
jgi:hypothetical protein